MKSILSTGRMRIFVLQGGFDHETQEGGIKWTEETGHEK